jgi:hypothetical protein
MGLMTSRRTPQAERQRPGHPARRHQEAVLAYGGKAAQYSILAHTPGSTSKAFAVPVSLRPFRTNGFCAQVDALLADASFMADATVRRKLL